MRAVYISNGRYEMRLRDLVRIRRNGRTLREVVQESGCSKDLIFTAELGSVPQRASIARLMRWVGVRMYRIDVRRK